MADAERRRRRLRHGGVGNPEQETADGAAVTPDAYDGGPQPSGRRRSGPTADDRDSERGLRGLIGSGASQVGVSAALRARDAARPTEADLAEAERRVTVVRRNWQPRDDQPRAGR